VTDELSPEESERFFERLERELSLGRRDWAVRMHVHRAGDSLQHALALTRGAAATKGSPPPGLPTFASSRRHSATTGGGVVVALPGGGKLVAAPSYCREGPARTSKHPEKEKDRRA
jgi:hypothetical protein